MMFDEETVRMARSLAQDLVRVKKEKQSILDAFDDMKNTVLEIWESIKQTVLQAYETIFGQDNECEINKNKPSKNWYVPMKIAAPPMPDIRMPHMANARSNI